MDLLTTPRTTRMQGLQLTLKSMKGQHFDMPILDYRQVCTQYRAMQYPFYTLPNCMTVVENVCVSAATCTLQAACFMVA
jgi:hypothetical protein